MPIILERIRSKAEHVASVCTDCRPCDRSSCLRRDLLGKSHRAAVQVSVLQRRPPTTQPLDTNRPGEVVMLTLMLTFRRTSCAWPARLPSGCCEMDMTSLSPTASPWLFGSRIQTLVAHTWPPQRAILTRELPSPRNHMPSISAANAGADSRIMQRAGRILRSMMLVQSLVHKLVRVDARSGFAAKVDKNDRSMGSRNFAASRVTCFRVTIQSNA